MMQPRPLLAPIALMSLLVGCGGNDAADRPPANLEEAMEQAAGINSKARSIEPVSAADLEAMLPATLVGFTRGTPERQDIAAMGMKISSASATYTGEGGRIEVLLTDTGGASAMAPMAAAWAMVEFDRTTSTGYERTIRFEGFKGHEELSKSSGRVRTELALLLGERIVLSLHGSGVEMDVLKDAARAMDLRRLARAG
jgi:hypothetical protein